MFQLQLLSKCLIFRLQGYWDGGERASIESPRGDQQEVSELADDTELPILLNIDQIMQTNVLKLMQRGGRPAAPTPRGAEEDDQPHSGDEHVKLFEVRIRSMFFCFVHFRCCLFLLLFVFVVVCFLQTNTLCFYRQSLHQAKEKIRDLEKDNAILRLILLSHLMMMFVLQGE